MTHSRLHIAIAAGILLSGTVFSGAVLGNGADQGKERQAEAEAAAKAKAKQASPDLSSGEGMDAAELLFDALFNLGMRLEIREKEATNARMSAFIRGVSRAPVPQFEPAPEPLPAPVEYDDSVIM